MDLTTLDVPKAEARQKFLDYKHAVQERLTDEDRAIMAGYRAIASGRTLIDLRETIIAGGLDEHGRPRLAAIRSDAEWCYLRSSGGHYGDGSVSFCHTDNPAWNTRRIRVRRAFDPTALATEYGHGRRAMVPVVPPALRPRSRLHNYVTLFEVEEWATAPRPPGDPALLKRIGGDLFAVLATWELTDLERAVLGQRNL